jgi:hypothetical protein
VELELSECPHDWVPAAQSDSSVGFTARCADPPGLPIKWRFVLVDTSRLPGICNNANIDDFPSLAAAWQNSIKQNSPDLLFDFRYYGSKDKDFTTADPWQVLESTKTLVAPGLKVSCIDWGAYGKLTAFGEVDGHWIRAKVKDKDGKIVGDAAVIPWAKDQNDKTHIAHDAKPHDSAENYEQLSHGAQANSDEDDYPASAKQCKGDGLSLFEEYRGFFVRAGFEPDAPIIYRRLYPDVKDFFVFLEPDSAVILSRYLEDFQKASGLMVHRVGNDSLTQFIDVKTRVVNFNRGDIGSAQHAVELVDFDLAEDGLAGQCSPRLGPPVHVNSVCVASNKISAIMRSQGRAFRDFLKQVTVHELGHAASIEHHGSADDLNNPTYHEVANEGGQHSGQFDCAMRYVGANFYLHWASAEEPDPDYHPYDLKHEQIGLIFCEARKGTGLNDRTRKGWQCGDAYVGSCKGQIVVNDHCGGGAGGSGSDIAYSQDQSTATPFAAADKSARKSQSQANIAVRLETGGGHPRGFLPGEAIVFNLHLTGLASAALELGSPNESWTRQVAFKIVGPDGKLRPWPANVHAVGTPLQQEEPTAPGGPPLQDKPAPGRIKIAAKTRYRAAFALDSNDALKLTAGGLQVFATVNNGTIVSNVAELKIRRPDELSPEERALADSTRALSQARVAYADDKFEETERLAREVLAKVPDYFEAHLLLARTLEKEKKLREAYDEYGKALQTRKVPAGKSAEAPEEILFALQALGEQLHIELQPPPPPRPFVSHSLFAELNGVKTNEPFPSHANRIVFQCELANPGNNPLGIRWIATDTGGVAEPNHLITSNNSKPGEMKPQFALKTPPTGLPPGEYRLEVWQDGKRIYIERFNVNP